MKGIILSGGNGTRLLPLTATTSKQLLPVYDRQMIFYPLNTLISAGIHDILVIVAPDHSGQYLNLLGSIFEGHGIRVSFTVQKRPRGLAEAFIIGEDFLDDESVTMVLGDNIFEDDFSEDIRSFTTGARIFAKAVPDPERFGVVEFDDSMKVVSIQEKPDYPKSTFAIPGIYVYDNRVVSFAKQSRPSERGELEITELHNAYLCEESLDVRVIEGGWFDAGTFESLLEASEFAKNRALGERFDPIVKESLQEFTCEFKKLISL